MEGPALSRGQSATPAVKLKDSPRWFDVPVALLGLLVLSPVLVLVAVLVKCTSRGPVIYRGRRVGKGGKIFHIYKFRTMVQDADKMGPSVTAASDPRITPVGRWLRRWKLDELPQLVNVLKGDMAFVGPRPESPEYVPYYTAEQRELLTIRPGITSPATLAHRNEEEILAGRDLKTAYLHEVLPRKLNTDLAYFQNRTFLRDLALIVATVLRRDVPSFVFDGCTLDQQANERPEGTTVRQPG